MNVSFLGAGPTTSNLGVSALFATMVSGVKRRIPDVEVSVFDTSLGVRRASACLDGQGPISLEYVGLRQGRRYHRFENLWNMRVAARLGGLGRLVNPGILRLAGSAAVLDVSGGDSFTDMYPDNRMNLIAGIKELVLSMGQPLLLLPQTYGPFDESRERAASIVRRAAGCWARDKRSFECLKDLLGSHFDPERHRCGVDMAFGLVTLEPAGLAHNGLRGIVEHQRPLIGLNVSGLMYNNPEKTRKKYGFRADYCKVVDSFIEWVFRNTEHSICLIPHVMSPAPSEESDPMACEAVARRFGSNQDRILTSPVSLNQSEVKWVIRQMDWFCGTRMHATIAGLSTCTPTATVAYSDKALGVFESCGQGREVFDPRKLDGDSVVAGMIDSFERRGAIRESLKQQIPKVKAMAEKQMDDIASLVRRCGNEQRQVGRAPRR